MILSLFATAFVTCLFVAGVANEQGHWYFGVSVLGAVCHLFWQLYTIDFDNKDDCARKFKVSYSFIILWLCSMTLLVKRDPWIHHIRRYAM